MNRQRIYSDAEREADTQYQAECACRVAADIAGAAALGAPGAGDAS